MEPPDGRSPFSLKQRHQHPSLETRMEYEKHEPRVPSEPEVVESGISQKIDTQLRDGEKNGSIQSSFPRELFQKAYTGYLKATGEIWANYLSRCEDTWMSYVSAVERLSTELMNLHKEAERDYHAVLHSDDRRHKDISEQAYRRYMREILRAWDFEEALQQSKCAHSDYREALTKCVNSASIGEAQSIYTRELKLAWTPDITASCLDFYNDHVRRLADAWTDAQTGVSQAHSDYLQALQKAWAAIDIKDVDEGCLAEIGQSMTSVALQPALHAKLWQASPSPGITKMAGKSRAQS